MDTKELTERWMETTPPVGPPVIVRRQGNSTRVSGEIFERDSDGLLRPGPVLRDDMRFMTNEPYNFAQRAGMPEYEKLQLLTGSYERFMARLRKVAPVEERPWR